MHYHMGIKLIMLEGSHIFSITTIGTLSVVVDISVLVHQKAIQTIIGLIVAMVDLVPIEVIIDEFMEVIIPMYVEAMQRIDPIAQM